MANTQMILRYCKRPKGGQRYSMMISRSSTSQNEEFPFSHLQDGQVDVATVPKSTEIL